MTNTSDYRSPDTPMTDPGQHRGGTRPDDQYGTAGDKHGTAGDQDVTGDDQYRAADDPYASGAEQNRTDPRATTSQSEQYAGANRHDGMDSGYEGEAGEASGYGESPVPDAAQFRARWDSIKVAFVDDPRRAVADAESLLGEMVEQLLAGFRQDRQQLEAGWERGDEASTEHLRRTLHRYRSLYERLLETRGAREAA